MSSTFRETFNAVRREVQVGPSRVFDEAKARHRCLARHATVLSALAVMGEESPAGWVEREALTRALIEEHQATSLPFWASALLVAYYPMLSRLRHRIWGDALDRDDLDQLVVSCFLQVVAAFPLAAGVFYPVTVSPEVAALAMSGSTVLVAINALLLKRTRLEGIRAHGAAVHTTAGEVASA